MAQPPRRGPRPQNSPVSDIERFLQEVERLRRKTADEKQQRSGDDAVDDVEVVGAPPPPPPPPRQQARPRPRPVQREVLDVLPAQPPAPKTPSTPSATSAYDQPRLTTVPIAQISQIALIERPAEIVIPRAAGQGGIAATQTSVNVQALLRSKQLKTAMMLVEILGPPACHRRR